MSSFRALWVEETGEKQFTRAVIDRDSTDLPEGEVLISVQYSSVNFKDALSATGNKGVTREYPHTPGIDAAGTVIESADSAFSPGDEVIVTGYDLGMNTAGGFGQQVRVPAAWVIPRPTGLSLREAMILGTAGLTAALCLDKLLNNGLSPGDGDVLVTGASGGVGSIAVALLAKLEFDVQASTGKESCHDLLRELGATELINRAELGESSPKPLLKPRWAGAIDVVGGETLFNVLKSLLPGGSAACCGLVESPMFQASVFPFILRGVNLLGVDSVEIPLSLKEQMWNRLGAEWKLDCLDRLATEISLDELDSALDTVLKGQAQGRYLLNLQS